MEAGIGRTRFLAAWGIISGGAFFVAVAFTFVALLGTPACRV